ncbi:MAG: hypothetical protein J7L55_04355 [Desulfurococcales archaeon]|nr:hypothetical protein [Desulfurococcales archaeon]
MDLLLVATDLAMLTYVLGVLVLAMPIPYRGLKSWGPKLMADAIMAAVLASSVSLIMYVGDYLLGTLGVTWPSFYGWLTGLTTALTSVFAGLTYASSLVRTTSYAFASRPISTAASLLAAAFSSLKMIYLLSSFVYVYREKLAVLGVVLYSIPFRVGKSAGSFLIAASIVMYVGFPLMPSFVTSFQGVAAQVHESPTSMQFRYQVIDLNWRPVPYPIMKFYADTARKHLVGEVVGNSAGLVTIGGSKDALPRNFTLHVTVSFAGFEFIPTPEAVSSEYPMRVLRITSLLVGGGSAVVIPAGTVVRWWGSTSRSVHVEIQEPSSGGEVFIVRWGSNASVSVDEELHSCLWGRKEWNALTLYICRIGLTAGPHNVTLVSHSAYYQKPVVEEKRLVYIDSIMDLVSSVLATAVAFLYTAIFLPGVYLGLLTSLTAGLSRVLGGGRVRLI